MDDIQDSLHFQQLCARIAAGDAGARDELMHKMQQRLEFLARKMLKGFPKVRRWEETCDIVQSASIRLLRALEEVQPVTQRALYGLAAEQIRRVLLDLARHYQGPQGMGFNHASVAVTQDKFGANSTPRELDPPAPETAHTDLDRWTAFHRAIERLPAEEREVVSLTYYHGWTQLQIAEIIQVSERTVRRYWQSACLTLFDLLGGELPAE